MFTSIWQSVARPSRHATERVAPTQAITREEAIRCATIGGAHLSYDEDSKGSLEPGKLADLVVLSDDPLTCAEDEIANIVAELTIVDGSVVFDRESMANREPATREAQAPSADK
jgi:predicted amidohydrolase YtcJ